MCLHLFRDRVLTTLLALSGVTEGRSVLSKKRLEEINLQANNRNGLTSKWALEEITLELKPGHVAARAVTIYGSDNVMMPGRSAGETAKAL